MADQEEGVPAPNVPPAQPPPPQQQDYAGQQQQVLHLNWSNFKPQISRKPAEDAEAHLLCLNDLMNAYNVIDGVKCPKILSYIVGRGKIMVPITRTHKCRLARVTKLI